MIVLAKLGLQQLQLLRLNQNVVDELFECQRILRTIVFVLANTYIEISTNCTLLVYTKCVY